MTPSSDAWTVLPGRGVGTLRFGMSPEQVEADRVTEIAATRGSSCGIRPIG